MTVRWQVSQSSPPSAWNESSICFQEPIGAHLVVLSMGEDHIMYVADLSPPSDPEDTVQLVSACEEFLCHFRPNKNAAEDERDSQPTSLASHPDRSFSMKVKA